MSGINMSRTIIILSLIFSFVLITGCARSGAGYHERSGRAVGSVVGQVLGAASGDNYQVARALGGAAVGSYIGGRVGRSMDDYDRRRTFYALEHSRNNYATSWTNRNSRNRYVITPANRSRIQNNLHCREYASEVWVQGRRQVYYGYACKDRYGYWRDARR